MKEGFAPAEENQPVPGVPAFPQLAEFETRIQELFSIPGINSIVGGDINMLKGAIGEAQDLIAREGNKKPRLLLAACPKLPFFPLIDDSWNAENAVEKIINHFQSIFHDRDYAENFKESLKQSGAEISREGRTALGQLIFDSYRWPLKTLLSLKAHPTPGLKEEPWHLVLGKLYPEPQDIELFHRLSKGFCSRRQEMPALANNAGSNDTADKMTWSLLLQDVFSDRSFQACTSLLQEIRLLSTNVSRSACLFYYRDLLASKVADFLLNGVDSRQASEVSGIELAVKHRIGESAFADFCADFENFSSNPDTVFKNPFQISVSRLKQLYAGSPKTDNNQNDPKLQEICARIESNYKPKLNKAANATVRDRLIESFLKQEGFFEMLESVNSNPDRVNLLSVLVFYASDGKMRHLLRRIFQYRIASDPAGYDLDTWIPYTGSRTISHLCALAREEFMMDYLLPIASRKNFAGVTALNILGAAYFNNFHPQQVKKVLAHLFATAEDYKSGAKVEDLFILLSYCQGGRNFGEIMSLLLERDFVWRGLFSEEFIKYDNNDEVTIIKQLFSEFKNFLNKNPILHLLADYFPEAVKEKLVPGPAGEIMASALSMMKSLDAENNDPVETRGADLPDKVDWPLLQSFHQDCLDISQHGISGVWKISPLVPRKKGQGQGPAWEITFTAGKITKEGLCVEEFKAEQSPCDFKIKGKPKLSTQDLEFIKAKGFELVYGYMVRQKNVEANRPQPAAEPINIVNLSPAEATAESTSADETSGGESVADLNPAVVLPHEVPQRFVPKKQGASRIDMRHRPQDAALVEAQKHTVRGILHRNLDLLGALRAEQTPEAIEKAYECQGSLHEELIVYRRFRTNDNNIGRFERLSADEVLQRINAKALFSGEEDLYAMTSEYYRKLAGIRWRNEKGIYLVSANRATATAQRAYKEHLASGMPSVGELAEQKSIDLKIWLDLEGGLAIGNPSLPASWPAAVVAATKVAAMNAVTTSVRALTAEEYENDGQIRALAEKKSWDWLESNLAALSRDLAEIGRELEELKSLTALDFQRRIIRACRNNDDDALTTIDRLEKKVASLVENPTTALDPELMTQKNLIAAQVNSLTDSYLQNDENTNLVKLTEILRLAEQGDSDAISAIENKRNERIADLLAEQALKNHELADFSTEQKRVAALNKVEIKIDPDTQASTGYLRLGLIGKNMGRETFNQGEFVSLADLFGGR